jgi:hypothetical protein
MPLHAIAANCNMARRRVPYILRRGRPPCLLSLPSRFPHTCVRTCSGCALLCAWRRRAWANARIIGYLVWKEAPVCTACREQEAALLPTRAGSRQTCARAGPGRRLLYGATALASGLLAGDETAAARRHARRLPLRRERHADLEETRRILLSCIGGAAWRFTAAENAGGNRVSLCSRQFCAILDIFCLSRLLASTHQARHIWRAGWAADGCGGTRINLSAWRCGAGWAGAEAEAAAFSLRHASRHGSCYGKSRRAERAGTSRVAPAPALSARPAIPAYLLLTLPFTETRVRCAALHSLMSHRGIHSKCRLSRTWRTTGRGRKG